MSETATGDFHAVLWDHGTITDLGTPPGGCCSIAVAINARGQVVGQSQTPNATGSLEIHAFLWERGTITDLGTLPGGCCSTANAINNRGQVVGFSQTPTGAPHAPLWTLK